jgi:hypothetical protein
LQPCLEIAGSGLHCLLKLLCCWIWRRWFMNKAVGNQKLPIWSKWKN